MLDKDLLKTLQRLKDLQKPALELQKIISSMEPLTSIMKQVDSMHGEMMKSFNELKNNPEFNFIRIVDNRILTEKQIADSILIIDNNLEKLLSKLGLKELWVGANFALNTTTQENPDRIRHFFISTRTLIEYLIVSLLAPDKKVKEWDKFPAHLEEYLKKIKSESVSQIPKSIRIKYVGDKIQFGILEELTEKEIDFINNLYKEVCKIHSPLISYSESELVLIKLKAGVTIWLLSALHEIIESDN